MGNQYQNYQKAWYEEILEEKLSNYTYVQQALFLEVKRYLMEQEHRINSLKLELDAMLWNPSEW